MSFLRSFSRSFLDPFWDHFWSHFGAILEPFSDASFDTNFGSYFGRFLDPFWTLSGVLSDLVEHLKTMQKPWFFTCFMAIPGFTRDSKGHEKHVKYRSSFLVWNRHQNDPQNDPKMGPRRGAKIALIFKLENDPKMSPKWHPNGTPKRHKKGSQNDQNQL